MSIFFVIENQQLKKKTENKANASYLDVGKSLTFVKLGKVKWLNFFAKQFI